MNFLIIDDHEIVRRGLKQLLSEGYPDATFGEAGQIPSARDLLSSQQWNLVLLDIKFPEGNALDLIAEIKTKHSFPVLVVSSYPEDEFAVRSFQLGADGYLSKAIPADEMLEAVKKILSNGKYVTTAIAEKLANSVSHSAQKPAHDHLSRRELEVLRLVATGKTIKDIAANLTLSEKTVGTYRSRISEKLKVSTNVELTRYALKHRLVD